MGGHSQNHRACCRCAWTKNYSRRFLSRCFRFIVRLPLPGRVLGPTGLNRGGHIKNSGTSVHSCFAMGHSSCRSGAIGPRGSSIFPAPGYPTRTYLIDRKHRPPRARSVRWPLFGGLLFAARAVLRRSFLPPDARRNTCRATESGRELRLGGKSDRQSDLSERESWIGQEIFRPLDPPLIEPAEWRNTYGLLEGATEMRGRAPSDFREIVEGEIRV